MKVGHRCEEYPDLHANDFPLAPIGHGCPATRAGFRSCSATAATGTRGGILRVPEYVAGVCARLKPSEGASLFSKFAGLTLGLIYLDQGRRAPARIFPGVESPVVTAGHAQ